jgi:hypothetical protein
MSYEFKIFGYSLNHLRAIGMFMERAFKLKTKKYYTCFG